MKYFLEQCLCSLFAAFEFIDGEVWVVDNASSDNSLNYLQAKFSKVNFVSNTVNEGFAKANNQVLKSCKGKYVLFLNPDTIVAEDSLIKCIKFMDDNAATGALGVRMIDGSGQFLPESKRSFPSPANSFYKLSGLIKLFPGSKKISDYSLGYLNQYQNHEVDVLSGAFFFSRREILLKLNGFDESFFMYGEDIDLSYRIKMAGYKNFYFSETTIIHFKGESTKTGSLNYVKMFYKAMSVFVGKHYSGNTPQGLTFFLNAAIWLTASFSAVRKVLKKIKINSRKSRVSNGKTLGKTLFVGDQQEYKKVKHAIDATTVKRLKGQLTIDEFEKDIVNNSSDLNLWIKNKEVSELIFCQCEIGFKRIIDNIQKVGTRICISFYGKGTGSIVGSDSKNTSGRFLTLQERVD